MGSGYYCIINRLSGKAINMPNKTAGTQFVLNATSIAGSQKFRLVQTTP